MGMVAQASEVFPPACGSAAIKADSVGRPGKLSFGSGAFQVPFFTLHVGMCHYVGRCNLALVVLSI